jgi:hypothetical protein
MCSLRRLPRAGFQHLASGAAFAPTPGSKYQMKKTATENGSTFSELCERLGNAMADVIVHPECPAFAYHLLTDLCLAIDNSCPPSHEQWACEARKAFAVLGASPNRIKAKRS